MKTKKPFNPKLYLVTDPVLSLGRPEDEVVRRAAGARVTMVQYRDKDASTRRMVEKTRLLSSICKENGVSLVVNDRLDVALAGFADGVHLGQDDMELADARRIVREDFIIGVSVTTREDVIKAEADGADYVAANGVFPTATKTNLGKPLGLKGVEQLVSLTKRSHGSGCGRGGRCFVHRQRGRYRGKVQSAVKRHKEVRSNSLLVIGKYLQIRTHRFQPITNHQSLITNSCLFEEKNEN